MFLEPLSRERMVIPFLSYKQGLVFYNLDTNIDDENLLIVFLCTSLILEI